METKEIILPDDWEVKEVKGNKIILGEADKKGLPKTYDDCFYILGGDVFYPLRMPCGQEHAMEALGKLLLFRNAWWQQLGWKPDLNEGRHTIIYENGEITARALIDSNAILSFPTIRVRDEFLETFRDLIEEAKELL